MLLRVIPWGSSAGKRHCTLLPRVGVWGRRASGRTFCVSSTSSGSKPRGRETYGTFWEEWKKYRMPAALGFGCLAILQAKRIYFRESTSALPGGCDDRGLLWGGGDGDRWNHYVVAAVRHGIPYRWLSHIWGKLAHVSLPGDWMRTLVYRAWSRMYNCRLDEMKYPLAHYSSLSEFFLRPLKDGVRHVDVDSPGVVVSPVDARVLHVGTVDAASTLEGTKIEQVKGVTYSLEGFLGKFPHKFSAERLERGGRKLQTVVLYLAPGDYHHFHSPVDWEISQRRHFPGSLLPVRAWAVEQISGLYSINERVVLNGAWAGGYFSLGAVGALNVGSIGIAFDKALVTNGIASAYPYQRNTIIASEKNYASPITACRGQHIGYFDMGSTIVLVFETSEAWEFLVSAGDAVRVGQRLGTDQPDASARVFLACPPWPNSTV